MLKAGFDKTIEKRVWSVRARSKLRVGLGAEKIGVICYLHHFYQATVWAGAAGFDAPLLILITKAVIGLIAVPVTLCNGGVPINPASFSPALQATLIIT
jgi:hypothetical protein